jgi:tyrosyl-tRNA synthetase
MKDEMIEVYLKLYPSLSEEEKEELLNLLKNKSVNPRDIKEKLAFSITKLYWGEKEAQKAKEDFERIFRKKEIPSEISIFLTNKIKYPILDLLFDAKLAKSKSEAKRLILQKGVEIDNQLKKDWKEIVEIKDGMVIKVGKRNFVKIKIK